MAKKTSGADTWHGTRTVIWNSVPCGWCMDAKITGQDTYHRGCKHETAYYEKLYLCSCDCNLEWKPKAVVVNRDGTLGEVPADLVIEDKMERKRPGKKKPDEATTEVEQSDTTDEIDESIVIVVHSDEESTSSLEEQPDADNESVSEEAKPISESPHSE